MGNEDSGVRISEEDMKYLKKIIERSKASGVIGIVGAIGILLLILTVCTIYLCFRINSGLSVNGGASGPSSVLVLSIESNITDEERSDTTQVSNALSKGGMIRIGSSIESMEYSMGTSFWQYGAKNTKDEIWTYGAILNYISSKGWKLIQSSYTTQALEQYYFTR